MNSMIPLMTCSQTTNWKILRFKKSYNRYNQHDEFSVQLIKMQNKMDEFFASKKMLSLKELVQDMASQ